jgi:hypothetical protein
VGRSPRALLPAGDQPVERMHAKLPGALFTHCPVRAEEQPSGRTTATLGCAYARQLLSEDRRASGLGHRLCQSKSIHKEAMKCNQGTDDDWCVGLGAVWELPGSVYVNSSNMHHVESKLL